MACFHPKFTLEGEPHKPLLVWLRGQSLNDPRPCGWQVWSRLNWHETYFRQYR